jgi:UDP-N-acetylmuramoyl-L-alanyl-D-glutamate--2,6-diaminopimelate ligase
MPRLGEMLQRAPEEILEGPFPSGFEEIEVTGVAHDSRKVRKGGLFVARRGLTRDGQDYVPQAEGNGASVIVSDRRDLISHATWLRAPDPRRALAHLAAAFYDHPSRAMNMVGVTGTNGKTSLCYLLRDAWHVLGHKSASLGTLGVSTGDPEMLAWLGSISWPSLTTPEAPDYQAALAKLLKAGVHHVACEVSSHALAMGRVVGTHFRVVVFTNLGRDHLDFHETQEAYRDAKWRLFTPEGRDAVEEDPPAAILNVDDPEGRRLEEALAASPGRPGAGGIGRMGRDGSSILTYGLADENGPWLRGSILDSGITGLLVEVRWPGGDAHVRTELLGRFHASHLLGAMGCLMALGTAGERAAEALCRVKRVPGRMEPVGEGLDSLILVDFAHSPDALETVLRECRAYAERRVVVVFGCGGDRDPGKRPLMGLTAGQLADEVIVTTDNARSENPRVIAEDVVEGLRATSAHWEVILDRREALAEGVRRLGSGDLLLVAGRGAEQVQKIGDREIPFDDREVLRELIGTGG